MLFNMCHEKHSQDKLYTDILPISLLSALDAGSTTQPLSFSFYVANFFADC